MTTYTDAIASKNALDWGPLIKAGRLFKGGIVKSKKYGCQVANRLPCCQLREEAGTPPPCPVCGWHAVASPVNQIPTGWYHRHFVTLLTDTAEHQPNFLHKLTSAEIYWTQLTPTGQFKLKPSHFFHPINVHRLALKRGPSVFRRRAEKRECQDIRHLHIWHILSSWKGWARRFDSKYPSAQ